MSTYLLSYACEKIIFLQGHKRHEGENSVHLSEKNLQGSKIPRIPLNISYKSYLNIFD